MISSGIATSGIKCCELMLSKGSEQSLRGIIGISSSSSANRKGTSMYRESNSTSRIHDLAHFSGVATVECKSLNKIFREMGDLPVWVAPAWSDSPIRISLSNSSKNPRNAATRSESSVVVGAKQASAIDIRSLSSYVVQVLTDVVNSRLLTWWNQSGGKNNTSPGCSVASIASGVLAFGKRCRNSGENFLFIGTSQTFILN